jgi:hypothetical protein
VRPQANYLLTGTFAIELFLKMVGYGWRLYFQDSFNAFDFIIVVVSLFELMPTGGGGVSLTALRSFRVSALSYTSGIPR